MNKVYSIISLSILLIALATSAAYPTPFETTTNTATVVGSQAPTTTAATSILSDISPLMVLPTTTVEVEGINLAKKICEVSLGCYNNEACYPFGFIKESTYCGNYFQDFNGKPKYKGSEFQDQKGEDTVCQYDFECKSNFCLNQQCVNGIQELIGRILGRLRNLEKESPESIRQEIVDLNITEPKPENVSNQSKGFWARLFRK